MKIGRHRTVGFEKRDKPKEVRERYKVYYRDLYSVYKGALSEETFYQGDMLRFTEMAESILPEYLSALSKSDISLLIICYWTPEFDPDYSAPGPHFVYSYGLSCNSFDVTDCGSLASSTALWVASRMASSDPDKNIVVLGLEQTTIPRDASGKLSIPDSSRVAAITLGPQKDNSSIKYIQGGHYSEGDLRVAESTDLLSEILQKCKLQSRNNKHKDLTVDFIVTRETTKINNSLTFQGIQFLYLDPVVTGLTAFDAIEYVNIHSREDSGPRFYLVIDEMVDGSSVNWFILKAGECDGDR